MGHLQGVGDHIDTPAELAARESTYDSESKLVHLDCMGSQHANVNVFYTHYVVRYKWLV